MSRLFQPKLSNPLHASDVHQSTPLTPILKTSVTPQRGLHDSNPAASDVDAIMILEHDTFASAAPDVEELSYPSPDAATVQDAPMGPAFFYSAMDQDQPSTIATSKSPGSSSLEDITRMNLLYLMASQGIQVPEPHFSIQPALQLSPHHLNQHIPSVSYTNTAQPLITGSMTSRTKHTREEDSENEPVNMTTDDSSSYITEDDSAPQPHKPSHTSRRKQKQVKHRRVLSRSLKTNTPLFPKSIPKPPLTKPRIFDWANGLNRLWYLMEQGKYNHNDHHQLRSLLESINQEKDRPGLGLMWLKDTKLIDILKRFRRDERLQHFDPWVRDTAGQIIQFWKGQFTGNPNS
ncbi:hypothetical protein F5887DRAFT_936217 [Amanita rubescens]|nr:hypothetical protein F5887DRAFT_936217 [Amanita rubescens]